MKKRICFLSLAGACAGAIAGIFGAGGGLILVPFLERFVKLDSHKVFPTSVIIILSICITSILSSFDTATVQDVNLLFMLLGSTLGGFLSAAIGGKIPVKWLHRILGAFVLYGGFRNLCL